MCLKYYIGKQISKGQEHTKQDATGFFITVHHNKDYATRNKKL